MTSISLLRSAIADLDSVLRRISGDSEFAGIRLTRQGLENRRAELEAQLLLAQRSELQVHLDGPPVVDHEIRVDALSRFLGKFQEAVSSTAQALTGHATARAPIPGSVREASELRFASVFAGSFGAILRGPEQRADEGLFELATEPSVLDLALGEVLAVLDLSSADDGSGEDRIVERVAPLGARTFGHLKGLSQQMADERLSAEFEWKAVGADSVLKSRLTAGGARRLKDVLTHNSATEEVVSLEGRLGTASEIRNMVELQLASGQIVSAQVIDELVGELRRHFGTSVRATFDLTVLVSSTTGVERRTYVLTALEAADG